MSSTTSSISEGSTTAGADKPPARQYGLDPSALASMRDEAAALGELARNEQQKLRAAVGEGRLRAREIAAPLSRLERAALRAERLSHDFHLLVDVAEAIVPSEASET